MRANWARRNVVLATTVAVAVGLGLGAALLLATRPASAPTDDMHRRYQVTLERPPVEVALWFVAHYPQYFESGETELGPWLATLDPRDRDFVLALGQTLTWAWIEHELANLEDQPSPAIVRGAIEIVRSKTLNQLELNVDHYPEVADTEFDAFVEDQWFVAGVFARLVRGVSNCEGQNHLLAALLEAGLESDGRWLPGRTVSMVGVVEGHELIRVDGLVLGQPVFVDGWSNLPAFTLGPTGPYATRLSELGPVPAPVAARAATRAPLAPESYANAEGIHVQPLSSRHAPTKPVEFDMPAPALDAASLARETDPWKLYLYARILHIYDDPRAATLYRSVLARDCDGHRKPRTFRCASATLLLERLG